MDFGLLSSNFVVPTLKNLLCRFYSRVEIEIREFENFSGIFEKIFSYFPNFTFF